MIHVDIEVSQKCDKNWVTRQEVPNSSINKESVDNSNRYGE